MKLLILADERMRTEQCAGHTSPCRRYVAGPTDTAPFQGPVTCRKSSCSMSSRTKWIDVASRAETTGSATPSSAEKIRRKRQRTPGNAMAHEVCEALTKKRRRPFSPASHWRTNRKWNTSHTFLQRELRQGDADVRRGLRIL